MRSRERLRTVPRNVAIAPASSLRHFAHGCVDGERRFGQLEVPPGDGRDQRHLVALGERGLGIRVALVDRVEQARRLVPELEGGPHVAHASTVGELELARAGAGALA